MKKPQIKSIIHLKSYEIWQNTLPKGLYREQLRADKVWAHGEPWPPCSKQFSLIRGEPRQPKSSKNMCFCTERLNTCKNISYSIILCCWKTAASMQLSNAKSLCCLKKHQPYCNVPNWPRDSTGLQGAPRDSTNLHRAPRPLGTLFHGGGGRR